VEAFCWLKESWIKPQASGYDVVLNSVWWMVKGKFGWVMFDYGRLYFPKYPQLRLLPFGPKWTIGLFLCRIRLKAAQFQLGSSGVIAIQI